MATFVGGLTRALCESQESLACTRLKQILQHFDEDDDGSLIPHTQVFSLNEVQDVTIPEYVLSRIDDIGIDEVNVKCSATIVDFSEEEVTGKLHHDKTEVRYFVKPSAAGDKSSFELSMKFIRQQDCEAENLLAQYLNETIHVCNTTKQEDKA